jgi:hypothetical protein
MDLPTTLFLALICIALGFLLGRLSSQIGGKEGKNGKKDASPAPAPDRGSAPSVVQSPPVQGSEAVPSHRRSPFRVFARALEAPAKPKIAAPSNSLVAQIDDILQGMIEGTPAAGRGIRLVEMPGQGMAVMVGLERYDSVEAVPDVEIRALLRRAVAEWEKQITN